jgi:hypothetical protein
LFFHSLGKSSVSIVLAGAARTLASGRKANTRARMSEMINIFEYNDTPLGSCAVNAYTFVFMLFLLIKKI